MELVQSVERTLTILEVLSDYDNGIGITEISEKVDLHKSTVYRLLDSVKYFV
jgi:IclR family KDG regulon transcriptional repressor